MSLIQHPQILQNDRIVLQPLALSHFEALWSFSKNEIIWQHMPKPGYQEDVLKAILLEACEKRAKGEQYPWVVVDKQSGEIVGCTRLLQINPDFRTLEIGYTWYNPNIWGSGINENCKTDIHIHKIVCHKVTKAV